MNANAYIVIAFVGFNSLLVGGMLYKRFMTNRTKDWPSVMGKVKSSRVSFESSTEKVNGTPWVVYVYEIHGKKYQNSVIVPGDLTLAGNDYAEKVVARYPAGTEVNVYYNPSKPADSFLERYSASDSGERSLLIGGNALLVIGTIVYQLITRL